MGKRTCGRCGKDNGREKIYIFDLTKTNYSDSYLYRYLCENHFDPDQMDTYADGRKRLEFNQTGCEGGVQVDSKVDNWFLFCRLKVGAYPSVSAGHLEDHDYGSVQVEVKQEKMTT